MNSYRERNQNRQRSKDPLERRMDQWFKTGRQFVDGVSGNRPGQRRSSKPISSRLDNVGRWVEDKIDWFFEDGEDWMEPWQLDQQNSQQQRPASKKRPLEAISLRGTKAIGPNKDITNSSYVSEDWPDESSFRVNKWERQENTNNDQSQNSSVDRDDVRSNPKRPLPKSNRRKP
ncbi:RNA helicase [Prochlorococcus sp. MIT 1223]|uniref:RNA helicase n=1 Tax=Prochlorococcus sp. MIT 1223 TaxID=3096217 RepID=UPI002A74E246|nr:RNA helicase [Prochlorococcus sp. MIT 1223]